MASKKFLRVTFGDGFAVYDVPFDVIAPVITTLTERYERATAQKIVEEMKTT